MINKLGLVEADRWTNCASDVSEMKEALISVKGGGAGAAQIRDLRGTVEREGAALGVFLCIEPPTKAMLKEAAEAGFYSRWR